MGKSKNLTAEARRRGEKQGLADQDKTLPLINADDTDKRIRTRGSYAIAVPSSEKANILTAKGAMPFAPYPYFL
jgi:hypothetical protein